MIAMWVIENVDDAGEGMFICNARTKKIALKMHAKKNPDAKVTSCERVKWVDLALVSGVLGESYYYRRVHRGESETWIQLNEQERATLMRIIDHAAAPAHTMLYRALRLYELLHIPNVAHWSIATDEADNETSPGR